MNRDEKNRLNGHIVRRILIAIYCFFIGAFVLWFMFNAYDPTKNSIRALSSVSMDVVCMIILIIIIASIAFGKYESSRTTRLFAVLLVATTWAMFLDFLNWAFDGLLEFGHLTFWFTVGSLCMGAVLAGIFCLYLGSYMEETHGIEKMRKPTSICAIMNLVSFILTFVLAVTGTAFQFADGHYETGALYDLVTIIPILTLLYITISVICSVKKIGIHDVMAVTGYIVFMIIGALIEEAYAIGTTYVAVAIANMFIFAMLQNEVIALEKRNVEKWKEKSNTDVLTRLYSRHAYEADLTELEGEELDDDFVYVSVDVNSLKVVNDSFGHNAGDELLIGATECLKECFGPYGKLYRIGGDEFSALIHANGEQLNTLRKNIEDITKQWSGKLVKSLTISCGFVAASEEKGMTVRQMAVLADRRMYEAKDEYYRSNGIERRKINIRQGEQ